MEARISDVITFTATEAGTESPDELRLHERFAVELLGVEIPMGEGLARIELRDVERQRDTTAEGFARYEARPAQLDLTFLLTPP